MMSGGQQSKTCLVPLTKDLKAGVNEEIDKRMAELNRCDNTPYVALYRVAYGVTRNLINALPDGYPVPVTKER